MNIKDRERMDEFGDKLNHLDRKIQGIHDALLDDERTSKIGLISEVEQMSKDLQVIMSAYKIGKWLVAIIITMFLSLLGHTFKSYI
jgi:hypothetical protein|tara:strand:+ start:185 stop:442 length:258 start_codon:yes stop_codon:yes gene_type:complete